jgi:type IV pilus assembly protein PilZ
MSPNASAHLAINETGRASSLLSLSIRDRAALSSAYMPFIEGGGLFVPTPRAAEIGDDVYLIMTLPDDPTRHALPGRVVWITPSGSGSRQQGLGIQFAKTEAGEQIRLQIESMIAAMPRSSGPTHTF